MTLSYIFNVNDLGVKDDHLDLKTKVQPHKVQRVQAPRVQLEGANLKSANLKLSKSIKDFSLNKQSCKLVKRILRDSNDDDGEALKMFLLHPNGLKILS